MSDKTLDEHTTDQFAILMHALRPLDALKTLDKPKRKQRDPIGTATLTMDEVDLVASYSYQRNIDPNGFDVFDITLTVKPNESLLDAIRDEIAFRLRQEEVAEREARHWDGNDDGDRAYDVWKERMEENR